MAMLEPIVVRSGVGERFPFGRRILSIDGFIAQPEAHDAHTQPENAL
jgi:hypothetical protein